MGHAFALSHPTRYAMLKTLCQRWNVMGHAFALSHPTRYAMLKNLCQRWNVVGYADAFSPPYAMTCVTILDGDIMIRPC
jgi:hypothetical protein